MSVAVITGSAGLIFPGWEPRYDVALILREIDDGDGERWRWEGWR
jgi:hypothetical protein